MPNVFSVNNLTFEKRDSRVPEFVWHTSPNLAQIVGSKYLRFDVRSLDPGKYSFPYHFHRCAEELFLIISGVATLRLPQGFQQVSQGDIIFFEEGPTSAHQLYNHGDSPCIYLDIRTAPSVDVCEYPDSGKVNILPYGEIFQSASKVDYYDGEEDVANKWPQKPLR